MAEYIEREALIADFGEEPMVWDEYDDEQRQERWDWHRYRRIVESQPAADVEPVTHGRWLPQILLGERVWDCSECKTLGSPHWKRCPVCEAKMEVDNGCIDNR